MILQFAQTDELGKVINFDLHGKMRMPETYFEDFDIKASMISLSSRDL